MWAGMGLYWYGVGTNQHTRRRPGEMGCYANILPALLHYRVHFISQMSFPRREQTGLTCDAELLPDKGGCAARLLPVHRSLYNCDALACLLPMGLGKDVKLAFRLKLSHKSTMRGAGGTGGIRWAPFTFISAGRRLDQFRI